MYDSDRTDVRCQTLTSLRDRRKSIKHRLLEFNLWQTQTKIWILFKPSFWSKARPEAERIKNLGALLGGGVFIKHFTGGWFIMKEFIMF